MSEVSFNIVVKTEGEEIMPPGVYIRTKSVSEETRRKASERMKGDKNPFYGKKHTEETLKKMGDSHREKPLSEEHKRKIGLASKGHTLSEEARKKISESRMGEKHWMFGKHLSEEHKRKTSETMKGKPKSEETRKNMVIAQEGKTMPPLIHHHVKYKEIHGVDEVVMLTYKEHNLLHRRLRKEGKCNIPPKELHEISAAARQRRKSTSEPTV